MPLSIAVIPSSYSKAVMHSFTSWLPRFHCRRYSYFRLIGQAESMVDPVLAFERRLAYRNSFNEVHTDSSVNPDPRGRQRRRDGTLRPAGAELATRGGLSDNRTGGI